MDFNDPTLRGFRRSEACTGDRPDLAVYDCACRCGGHVLIPVSHAELAGIARRNTVELAGGDTPAFGTGFYIVGHEPLGIAAPKLRLGPRTALKAST